MNFEYVDNVYRSRMTLLNILEERGYDVEQFRKFSPAEISVAVEAISGLGFTVVKKENPADKCIVNYSKLGRQKLETYLNDFKQEEDGTTEIIFMLLDPIAELHNGFALKYYMLKKLRVSFFSIPYIVFDPRTHVLVPKHEIVPQEEHAKIMEDWNLNSKSQMPMIRYHVDPIIRILGAIPGDIIRITRPSPSAGTYVFYRVVSP